MSIIDFAITPTRLNKNYLPKLPDSGDSLYIANLANKGLNKLFIIANDGYHVKRIYDELQLFDPNLAISIFPDYETLPYERVSPSQEIIASRLKTLWQIGQNQLNIVIIAANTLSYKVSPKEYLYSHQLILKVGDKISISTLKERLISSNYSLTSHVIGAGEFSVRGSIIDIIPIGSKSGVLRIELFDEEIESLRLIDPKTNITNNIDKYELISTSEYPQDAIALKTFVNHFNNYFDNPTKYGEFIKEVSHGILPAGCEAYLPLFFDNCLNLFDYIDNSWNVVYYEKLHHILNLNYQETLKRYELFKYQYPCLKPHDLFMPVEETFNKLNYYKSLIFLEDNTNSKKNIVKDLLNNFNQIPDISVNNRTINPFSQFINFKDNLNGIIILVTNSIGRLQIIREAFEKQKITLCQIKNFSEINLNKHEVYIILANLYNSFCYKNVAFISDEDLYKFDQPIIPYRRHKNILAKIDNDLIIRDLTEIEIGDYVVHINYGIGKYMGHTLQKVVDIEYEMIELEYANGSKLFIPVNHLHLISRYAKAENEEAKLSTLGSNAWHKLKAKTEKKVEDLASQLLDLYSKRALQKRDNFALPKEYIGFATSFGYEPTTDQEECFQSVIEDLTSSKPMDRLICGDVGFGKTEVAMRAAFICAMNGYQVALLSPTTLLVQQHYENFINRFAGYPIKIAEVSRFKTNKEIDQTLELIKDGRADITIGTHRLIQNDIEFKNLGLIIIDEEHRFGVKQKEKLKQLRVNVNILSLTATPIPRTLSMALEGLRDFSIIATPPKKRLPINTIIMNDENIALSEAISREIRRGGQIFFLYNDVASINKMYDRLAKLTPNINIAIAHGQMNENLLEQTIRDFIHQKYNLLLCSTIIENGIDIANANTIIIYNAHKFGLAQLHQLRGRVGRSHHQAYCYMIVPENLPALAKKRLEAIHLTNELGAGFNLAMHDLEIRGAGEVLGEKQSGEIKEVGLSLYTRMLNKAIRKLKHHQIVNSDGIENATLGEILCEVDLGVTAIINQDYCRDVHERLIYYKRLALANNASEIDLIYQELIDKNGLPNESIKALIQSHYLRIKAIPLGIKKVDATNAQIIFVFIDNPPIESIKIVLLLQQAKQTKYDGKNKLIMSGNFNDLESKITNVNYVLDKLK